MVGEGKVGFRVGWGWNEEEGRWGGGGEWCGVDARVEGERRRNKGGIGKEKKLVEKRAVEE